MWWSLAALRAECHMQVKKMYHNCIRLLYIVSCFWLRHGRDKSMSNSRTNKTCNTGAITPNNTTGRAGVGVNEIDRLMPRIKFSAPSFFFFLPFSSVHEWFVIYKTESTNKTRCAKLVWAWWKSSSLSWRLSVWSNLTCIYLCLNQAETCSWQHVQMEHGLLFFFFTRRLTEFWPQASFDTILI